MGDPFTIRIFVPDGDPEGLRIIDRMNWTGVGVAFPRNIWHQIQNRPEFSSIGVYILVGIRDEGDDLPTVYVGQGDGVRSRIDSHASNKDFWDYGIAFFSASGGLNRAHVTWLEHALINRVLETKRSFLDNSNVPQEPALTEAEKADTEAFLKEMLQILPLVGVQLFEVAKPVATPKASSAESAKLADDLSVLDTVVVPAKKEGFEKVFLGEDCWYAIRISGGKLDKIKFIAAYQSRPVSAITYYAPVDRIEPYGDKGKHKLIFSEKAQPIGPIPLGKSPSGAMQGPRYTNFQRLKHAKTVVDLIGGE